MDDLGDGLALSVNAARARQTVVLLGTHDLSVLYDTERDIK